MLKIFQRKKIDFTDGPLFWKLVTFMLPIIATSLLQILYDLADKIVVGQFSGDPNALGAIGSTSFISGLIINFLIGVGAGAGVLVAQAYGAKDDDAVSRSTHNAFILALILSTVMSIIAFATASPLLRLLDTDETLFDSALLYLNIIYSSIFASAIYNIGASVLRAIGDSSTSLSIGLISGLINVLLNLFFVIVCQIAVAGVALATTLSQVLSMILTIRCLMKSEGMCHLELRKLRIYKDKLLQLLRIGIPAGLQGCVFSFSNVIIQSSINSFGAAVISGNTASASIDGFMFCALDAFNQTTTSSISQNMGARQYKRSEKVVKYCTVLVIAIGLFLGTMCIIFREPLVGIYAKEADVIGYGAYRLLIVSPAFFTAGLMNMMGGVNRGLGYAVLPTVVALIGACAFRIVWIFTLFAAMPTLFMLYISYPITWALTAAAHYVCYFIIRKKAYAKNEALYAE